MKNKHIALLLLPLTLLFVLAGCGRSDGNTSDTAVSAVSETAPVSQTESAVSSVPEVSEEEAKLADGFLSDAIASFEKNNYTKCLVYANDAIAADPGRIQAYEYKGLAYAYLGEIDLGMEVMDYLVENHPQPGRAAYLKGLCYKCDDDYDNALIWFDKSVKYDAMQTWSWYGAATIYVDRDDYDTALDYLEKAIGTDSSIKALAKKQGFHWSPLSGNARFKALTSE